MNTKKEGNLKIYELNYTKKTYSYLTFKDINRFEKLPTIRREAIKRYLQKLPIQPVFAILFGSTAKETFTKESDMDILLITSDKIDSKEAEKEADAICAVKISTFQMNYADFLTEIKLKDDPVVQSALQTGYPIVNHIYFYEVLYERI